MPFDKGSPGRPKGSKNYLTRRVEEIASRIGVDPFEILCLFAKGDWEKLGYDTGRTVTIDQNGNKFEELLIKPELRMSAAKEASKYLYSQKKSIEHTGNNPFEGMTIEEKLEAMRHGVAALELQMKKKDD